MRALFEAACQRPEDERASFLAQACGSDAALRIEVERLLRLDSAEGARLEPPQPAAVLGALERAEELDLEGRQLGAYLIERRLASGGMGSVWLAARADRQFEKRVAIKIVKRGMDTEDILQRFGVERQILAEFDHPGLTRLLDAGVTEDGLPFLVMEYVDGVPIDRWCDERRLGLEPRLALFRRVCEAVDHAHRRGVVHRDIKPGNVLVDGQGAPKLLDFGIAKILDPEREGEITKSGARPMTPGYASPEQVRGDAVTPASDVYSLGVVLYELVTGRGPYGVVTTSRATLERAVCEADPPRPSSVVLREPIAAECVADSRDHHASEVSARRGTTPRRLQQQIEGDLDNVVLKALRKEPELRYASAGELSADLGRLQHGLPVQARPATWRYRAGKFVRRNRLLAASLVTALVVLGVASVVSTRLYLDARAGWGAEALRRVEAERRGYRAAVVTALDGVEERDVLRARRELEIAPQALRGWEWRHLAGRLDRSEAALDVLEGGITALATHPQERVVAVGGFGRLALVDLDRPRVLCETDAKGSKVVDLAFSPDGARLAGVLHGFAFAFWDARTLEPWGAWEQPRRGPRALALDDGWQRAACGFLDGSMGVWDVATGTCLASWSAGGLEVQALAFSPDGTRIASGCAGGRLRVWDAATGALAGVDLQVHDIWSIAYTRDGARLIAGLNDGHVLVLRASDGEILLRSNQHGAGGVELVPIGADGEFVTGATDRSLLVWAGEHPPRLLLGHAADVFALAWDGVGERILSGDANGELRVWSSYQADPRLQVAPGWYPGLALSPDGRRLATGGGWPRLADPQVQVWDVASGRRLWADPGHELAVIACAFSPDGRRLATGGKLGEWTLWDAERGLALASWRAPGELPGAQLSARERSFLATGFSDVAFSPDGSRLYTASEDGRLACWEPEPVPLKLLEVQVCQSPIRSLRPSPDGASLAVGCGDGTARILDAESLTTTAVLSGHEHHNVWMAVHDPTGEVLATASGDKTVRLWELASGRVLRRLEGHSHEVWCLAFSPDGSRLASGSQRGMIRLWDPRDGEELAVLHAHPARVADLAFAPDGSYLVSIDVQGSVRFWDTGLGTLEASTPRASEPPRQDTW